MSHPLRVLIVEDSADDALLLLRELRRGGYDPASERVETPEDFSAALAGGSWDLVIADYALPRFSAPAALAIFRETELDAPFIVVSGKVGEEAAVATMKAGAHDYFMKDNLTRLAAAVDRELREAEVRRQHMRAEVERAAYQEQLRSLASELSLTEERERRQVAALLHDDVGQLLAAASMKLGALRASLHDDHSAQSVAEISRMIEQAIERTRSLTFELSPAILYELGIEAAVELLIDNVQQRHHIVIELEDDGQPKPLEHDLSAALFQAVRELLFNVVKHAQAEKAQVSVRRDGDDIRIIVEDWGVGFALSVLGLNGAKRVGFGLFNIRERLHYLGGRVEVESQPGKGTRVTLVAGLKREGVDDVS